MRESGVLFDLWLVMNRNTMLSMIFKENCSDLLERLPTMYYKTSQDKLNEDNYLTLRG